MSFRSMREFRTHAHTDTHTYKHADTYTCALSLSHTHTHTHTRTRARTHARACTHTTARMGMHALRQQTSRAKCSLERNQKMNKICEFPPLKHRMAACAFLASRCNKTIRVLISQLFSSLTLLHRAPHRVTTSRHSPSSLRKGRACSLLVQLNRASSFRLEKATEESGSISWLRVWSASLRNQGRRLTRRRTLCLRRIQPTAQHEFYFKPRRVYSLWWE